MDDRLMVKERFFGELRKFCKMDFGEEASGLALLFPDKLEGKAIV